MHVFAGPELKISMPMNVQYAAVRSTAGGAPFRSITVRDTIGDLPPVENGASKSTINVIFWPLTFCVIYGYNLLNFFLIFSEVVEIVISFGVLLVWERAHVMVSKENQRKHVVLE